MPILAASSMTGHGVSSRSSHSCAAGRITLVAKPWTHSCRVFWSSLRSIEKSVTGSPFTFVASWSTCYSQVTMSNAMARGDEMKQPPPEGGGCVQQFSGLVQDDALGQWAAIAWFNVKLYGLTFYEGLATITLNLRVVHKDVRLAINCDESPTLLVVEPLDGSYSHCGLLVSLDQPSLHPEGTTTETSTEHITSSFGIHQMLFTAVESGYRCSNPPPSSPNRSARRAD